MKGGGIEKIAMMWVLEAFGLVIIFTSLPIAYLIITNMFPGQ